jgi:hypothetical protein
MRYSLVVLLIFILPFFAKSQKKNLRNNVFIELAGNGGLGAINYERLFLNKVNERHLIGARVGIGYSGINSRKITLPFGIKYALALYKKNVFVDAGLGITYTKAEMFSLAIVEMKGTYV